MPQPELLLLLVCEDGAGVAVAEIQTRGLPYAHLKPTRTLNFVAAGVRMGLVMQVPRCELGPALQQNQRATGTL
jgi:hypothetical protein